ncbi:leucyl aminopeptidase [Verminephrobacter eiseniae]|uniref:leucyl aminopeptidase n=1 Tax=Verminephrobacter eiseniae TaxID=364317 RepID=UPI002237E116|nr:leucyl aminopeptidase [Verminephrobacter eiseniae]MCW5232754.1 leucyl aminopeptidase [Verminephrobacter eiseniae]MCW5295681.1 leucyl aminopeptidase [Verminephrobacter eiseniae]MCW8186638.1 leucyl aminopeptidase [Verminephrobacter eiseniae]MCW8221799.1 leucyl aminopeptidase [Verminephrobacter eiseniae]MCW8232511.1 leucyl aminopeptidase [Verminephrobacter eiseniae]
MNFDLKTLELAAAAAEKCDLLLVLIPEGFTPGQDALSTLAALALKNGDLLLKAGKHLQLYQVPAVAARRVILLGVGDGTARAVRQALLALGAEIKKPQTKRLVLCFAAALKAGVASAAVQAVAEASYVYTTTKSKAEARSLSRCVLGVSDAAEARPGFDCGVALVAGVEFAREWSNRPANHATPSLLADAAKTLGRLPHIQCKVHGPAQVRRLGMGAFVAVARGSEQPLRFIELRYSAAAKDQAPIVLVGKGITFDSGGISIKPAPEMDEMKFDMCGAASVLGVFRALGELQPAINVLGLIPACENLPDGRAIKPGDVVTSMSGQTIEILNTDAEGRLILCDALTYAARFKPAAVIDIATLTGACVVALAGVRSGLFANDDDLAVSLYEAGEAALDPCWRMPLDDDYADGLKSHFADMGNTAGRSGGAITAAKFLQKFVAGMRWAHLDIAGIAYKSGPAKGATGRPVGLLVHYLLAQAEAMAMAQQAPVAPAARPAAKRTGRSQGGLKRTAP